MEDPTPEPANEVLAVITNAMAILNLQRLLATMIEFRETTGVPIPPPGDPSATKFFKLINRDLNGIYEAATLRSRYVRRVHVDPECKKSIINMLEKYL